MAQGLNLIVIILAIPVDSRFGLKQTLRSFFARSRFAPERDNFISSSSSPYLMIPRIDENREVHRAEKDKRTDQCIMVGSFPACGSPASSVEQLKSETAPWRRLPHSPKEDSGQEDEESYKKLMQNAQCSYREQ